MDEAIRQVVIRGRVQGVGYRAFVEHYARRSGLAGWVRNRRDGSVEALFSGSEDVIADMIAACHRGPSSARVDTVMIDPAGSDALNLRYAGERFSVLSTV